MEMRRGLLQTHCCSALLLPLNSSAWHGANPISLLLRLGSVICFYCPHHRGTGFIKPGRSFLWLLASAIPVSHPRDNSVTLGVLLVGSATSGNTGRSVLRVGRRYGDMVHVSICRRPGPQLGWPVPGSHGLSLQPLGSQCPLAACPCWNSWKG